MGPTFLHAEARASQLGWNERGVGAGRVSGDHFGQGGLQVAQSVLA